MCIFLMNILSHRFFIMKLWHGRSWLVRLGCCLGNEVYDYCLDSPCGYGYDGDERFGDTKIIEKHFKAV